MSTKTVLWVIGGILLLSVLLLGTMVLPHSSCITEWFDSNRDPIEGPFNQCPAKLKERQIGRLKLASIGGQVYRVDIAESRDPAGFPCMTGVACFPIPQGRRTWKRFSFIRLQGPIHFDSMQSYLDGTYIGDGRNLFYDFKRLEDLEPPIDASHLGILGCAPDIPAGLCSSTATDGRYVLDGEKVLHGADPATFGKHVLIVTMKGTRAETTAFRSDVKNVFYGATKIKGADPATFGVLQYGHDDVAAGLPGVMVASDHVHAWRVGPDEVEQITVSTEQMRRIRSDLENATKTFRAMFKSP